ncbi:hypothetical protein SAMN05421824_2818 [Hyunsoonleella jejuensis]|uniref:Uncharacterized protein n=2 Tax=Hyunsoonleella jejuensis TaxID=419940 RepID=A0A1H9KNJ0_9FLAO|nr:hypothetical protein SAMN05421824_2818 [Hyunsoonleella jejuensis]
MCMLCLTIGVCHSQMISGDDKLHFGAGAVISGCTYAVVYSVTKNKKKAFWYSLGASTIAGLAKEVRDSGQQNNKFDTGEWIATTAGGLTVSTTISLFNGKGKRRKNAFLTD